MSEWLPVNPAGLPVALRVLPAVLWRAESRGEGKPTKVPYQVAYPSRKASSTDPSTWGIFEDAVEAYRCPELGVSGIGVMLIRAAGISCIDLDQVLDADGQLDSRAALVLTRANSWTEKSPSGSGLHVFLLGTVPRALKGPQIEVYSEARYIAVTGHHWPGTPGGLRGGQSYLDALSARSDEPAAPRREHSGPRTPPPDDLAGALLAKLQTWGVPVARLKPWQDGYLVELVACPWANEHTTGAAGAAVMIRASGAFDFTCQHAHCAGRRWREFRAALETPR